MRVIEKKMLAAIMNMNYFSNSNTMVKTYNGYYFTFNNSIVEA